MDKISSMSFYVENEKLEEAKKTIRSLDSLRFTDNPQQGREGYFLSVMGSAEDIKKLYNSLPDKCHGVHRTLCH